MDFYEDFSHSALWGKITRRVVDPVTFACTANVECMPRSEECSYNTTGPAIAEPRFGELYQRSMNEDISWTMGGAAPVPSQSQKKKLLEYAGTPKLTKSKKLGDTLGNKIKPASLGSLGAFFQKSKFEKLQEIDNMSLGSRSMNSRSIAERSLSERSQSEDKLKHKSKERRAASQERDKKERRRSEGSGSAQDMMESIHEYSINKWNSVAEMKSVDGTVTSLERKKPGEFFEIQKNVKGILNKSVKKDEDEDETSLTLDEIGKPEVKKFRIDEECNEQFEIPYLTNSMYDDLFYGSEELADFRYEAFLEEVGLDINEYM